MTESVDQCLDELSLFDVSARDDHFLTEWFLKLPYEIIESILDVSGMSRVLYTFLRVPDLRDEIYRRYCGHPSSIDVSISSNHPFQLFIRGCYPFDSATDLVDFARLYPGANPMSLRFDGSEDHEELKILPPNFERYISMAPTLKFHSWELEFTSASIKYLFSFPNLSEISITKCNFAGDCLSEFARGISGLKNLEKVNFSRQVIDDWSIIEFSPGLKSLDISGEIAKNVCMMKLPSSITNLRWSDLGITDNDIEKAFFPPFLSSLDISSNEITSIDLSKLPQTLESLHLSSNKIQNFEYDSSSPHWPPGLKSISLGSNMLTNESLKQLSAVRWPPSLEEFYLCSNKFTSIDDLRGLPSSLETLDLSGGKLESIEVKHNPDGYPFFRFPTLLKTLVLRECYIGVRDESTSLRHRRQIEFPPHLEKLNLIRCGISELGFYKFPASLISLYLSTNRIANLMYSDLDPVEFPFPFVDWQCFNGLKELSLRGNKLRDLCDWLPPPSIRELDVGANLFEILSPERFPLFDEKLNGRLVHLQTLYMYYCKIRELAENLTLPPNLKIWSLEGNELSSFIFTENIASHESLDELNLRDNNMSHISVVATERKFHMNLWTLHLDENDDWDMSNEELDEELKRLGLAVEVHGDWEWGSTLRRIES